MRQLPKSFNKFVMKYVDAIIASTPSIQQYVVDCGQKNKIHDIKHCYEYSRFSGRVDCSEFKKELRIPNRHQIVTFLGRLDPFKDPLTFIKALPTVLKIVKNVTFLIVGFGVLERQVSSLVKELKLERHVRITGARKDVPIILSASDIFVNLSPEENFLSVAIQEAMALKVACLLTDSGRTAELFTHKEFAYLVPIQDPTTAAEGMIELLTNSNLKERLQKNGPVFLEKFGCTKEAIKTLSLNLYQKLIAQTKQKS